MSDDTFDLLAHLGGMLAVLVMAALTVASFYW